MKFRYVISIKENVLHQPYWYYIEDLIRYHYQQYTITKIEIILT